MKPKSLWFALSVCAALAVPGTALAAVDARVADAVQHHASVAAVRALLAQHADVNAPQPDGATAIAWAAHWDDAEVADVLIRAGANVNVANDLAITPLMLASINGDAPMLEKLLAAGADPKAARTSGETAIILAARSGSVAAIKTLVAHGADVQAKTKSGDTALMFAAAERHPDAVHALIEGGADVQARAEFKKTEGRGMRRRPVADDADKADGDTDKPAQDGVDKGKSAEKFNLLYKGQAVVVAQIPKDGDNDPPRIEGGFTPLLHAAMAGDLECVKLLLKAGAKVDDAAPDGKTALMLAIIKHHEDVALFLIDQGAPVNPVEAGFTALHAAAITGQTATVLALLKHGADINAGVTMPLRLSSAFIPYNPDLVSGRLSQVGSTPFMLAAKAVDTHMMQLLVDHGADPLKKADDGTTALILAAGLGKRSASDMFAFIRYYTWDEARSIEAIKLCLALGIDINAANKTGETALHGATYHSATEVIKFLASKGANLNATNWSGQTPLRLAKGHFYSGTFVRYPEAIDALQKLGADPNAGIQLSFGLTAYESIDKKKSTGASEQRQ